MRISIILLCCLFARGHRVQCDSRKSNKKITFTYGQGESKISHTLKLDKEARNYRSGFYTLEKGQSILFMFNEDMEDVEIEGDEPSDENEGGLKRRQSEDFRNENNGVLNLSDRKSIKSHTDRPNLNRQKSYDSVQMKDLKENTPDSDSGVRIGNVDFESKSIIISYGFIHGGRDTRPRMVVRYFEPSDMDGNWIFFDAFATESTAELHLSCKTLEESVNMIEKKCDLLSTPLKAEVAYFRQLLRFSVKMKSRITSEMELDVVVKETYPGAFEPFHLDFPNFKSILRPEGVVSVRFKAPPNGLMILSSSEQLSVIDKPNGKKIFSDEELPSPSKSLDPYDFDI